MAKAKKKSKPESQAEQSERFLRAAEEAGADVTGKKFERAFKKVVLPKPRERGSRGQS